MSPSNVEFSKPQPLGINVGPCSTSGHEDALLSLSPSPYLGHAVVDSLTSMLSVPETDVSCEDSLVEQLPGSFRNPDHHPIGILIPPGFTWHYMLGI